VPGRHNVLNAVAAAALAHAAGATPRDVQEGLAAFRGIRRRFECLGTWRGIALIDDYAHHPTALAATLAAARSEFPRRRIWCAFQPHQVSRTARLLDDFAAALCAADEVLIPPVYSARETGSPASVETARRLVERCITIGGRARHVESLDRLVSTLETDPRPGEVILIIGAGDIDRVRDEFARRVPRHHAS
jgi:UDP-N-acetylmuramate--alanine ligase